MNTDATETAGASPYRVWDRVKVSKEFFDLLIKHPVFLSEPKAINTAQFWLAAIDAAMAQNDDEPVPWGWEDIQNRFQGFTQSHTKFRDALRDDLELITFTRYRIPPNGWVKGECRKFTVTPLGRQLIADANYQWLYKLLTDPKAMANNRSAISKRKPDRIVYPDPMMRIIDELHHGVKFQREGLLALLNHQKAVAPKRQRSALHHLLALERRKFKELRLKEGRIFNRFVALPSEYRPLAIYKGNPYVATVDIRACHPTFLGTLLLGFYRQEAPAITAGLNGNLNQQAFEAECRQWTEMFIHPNHDPREAIKAEAGIGLVKDDVKDCLNTWLNGAKKFKRRTDERWDYKNNRRLEAWFQGRFPEMAKVWTAMEHRRITGRVITEEYEGPLMLDPSLYAIGDELGLALTYEYDGVGVFAEPDDPELSAKLEHVKAFIQRKSVERFGVAVVVNGDVFGLASR
jgi:hypothetical protein